MLLTAVTTETSETKKKIKPKEKPLAGVPKVKTNLLPTPLASKGGYPCMFSTCNEILPVSRLVNHVRSSHSTLYTEVSSNFIFICFNIYLCFRVHLMQRERLK